ncbi:MAG: MBL fold metallo-hydrolase, partial [Clostridiales Family XIII bacterium]|nr:MBL fold metallo-hydrolase [Clostridiales Family XIII bacterium]
MQRNQVTGGGSRAFRLLLLALLMVSLLVAPLGAGGTGFAAAAPYMNIHAIYLGTSTTATTAEADSQGDATLLESGGKYLLIDTGDAPSAGHVLKYLRRAGATKLDILISHMHADHYRAIFDILGASDIQVGTIYLPNRSYAEEASAP